MRFLKRSLSLLLAAALLPAILSACSFGGGNDRPEERPSAVTVLTGLAPEELLFTVDGEAVTAEDYCYWLIYSIEMASADLYEGGDILWTDERDGVPMTEYVKNDAMEVCKSFAITQAKAREYGVELNAEEQAQLEATMEEYIQTMGEYAWNTAFVAGEVTDDMSEEALSAWYREHGATALEERCYELGTTMDGLRQMERVTLLYSALQSALFGEGGPMAADDQTVSDFLTAMGVYKAKHILISNKDEAGELLDAEALAQARRQAEELLAQLRASQDPITDFNILMSQNSEDPGLLYYPGGYLFTPEQMVEEFSNAVIALEENEISGIVESSNGYHIILRLSAVDEDTRSAYAAQAFEELSNQWLAAARTEETAAFAGLDVPSFAARLPEVQGEEDGHSH